MKKRIFISIAVLVVIMGIVAVPYAHALSNVPASPTANPSPGIDLTIQDLLRILTGLACWFTQIAVILMVGFMVFYGVLFLWSRGDPSKVTDAKKALGWGIVGVIVIMGTYTIIATVAINIDPSSSIQSVLPLHCSL